MKNILTFLVRLALVATVSLLLNEAVRAAISVDATAFGNQGTPQATVSTAPFSTTSGNELLLAFISADQVSSSATTVTKIATSGLTWVLVQRTNTQKGTAEIWRAFASSALNGVTVTATLSQSVCSSITVIGLNGVNTSGTNGSGAIGATGTGNANPGLPTATLITSGNGSLVLGVGNDWDNPIGRTVPAGQNLVHQYFPPVGDTYWVQMQSSPTLLSGTSVTINDTAPGTDRYNLSIVEVLAAAGGSTTGAINGTISQTGTISGATVQLLQGATLVATANVAANGSYSFANVANGTYTLQPSETGFTFSPTTANVTVNGNTVTAQTFTATATTGGINGTISQTGTISGATVQLLQGTTLIATANVAANGSYSFSSVANGMYTLQPVESGFTFDLATANVTVNGNTATAQTFTGTATTGTINGTVSQAGTISGATVQLLQAATLIATANVGTNGGYSFSNVANGIYTLQPSETGFTFSPTTANVTVNGNTVTAQTFTATANSQTFNISGTINPAQAGTGTTVTLSRSGTAVATTSANSSGMYMFTNVANGTYTVTPANSGFTFNPASQPVTVSGGNATVSVFNATAATTFPVTGTITPAAAGIGTTVTLSLNGTPVATALATTAGIYNFANIANGTYTVSPANNAYSFSPTTQNVAVSGTAATVANFNALSTTPLLFPDLQDILPPGKMSVVQTPSGRQFQYTHDTLDAGPGPLVIQPVFNAASGSYQGTQYIYSQNPNGTWSLVQQLPVGGAFIFDSDHGHFHFPLVTYGLYTVGPNGGPGTPVAVSAKVSFCINDSFIFLPNIPNAGQLGNLGSCSDPTSLRGLDIGAVDEYDQTDAGQSISIDNLPDGTYWLRAIDDPNNFLFEADKTNNETDVELTITGTTLTVLKTVVPPINNPPSISLTSPLNASTVSKTVQLTANTVTTSGVRYLVDGQSFGGIAATPPYSVSWDTTTVPDGTHWIAAQTTDPTGVIGTSPVAIVTVHNAAVTGPSVQLTSPTNGSIVSATISLYAQVGSSLPIQSVSFFVDFVEIGSALTAPPYVIAWDTTTVPDGPHTITVSASDSQANVGNSTPVMLSVDNSHPANLIGKDVTVSADGHDSITTAAFSTSIPSDLLVAFVSYDGPSNGQQTASATGAGLTWTLLERSNTQSGTAEIWSARADGFLSGVTVTASQNAGTGYHGSLTVIAFTNAAGTSVVGRTGAPNGAPDIPLPGVIAGDWVFAVGNDWDNPIARVPVSGQVLVHQKVDTVVGDTYWVQSTTAPSVANALVDIHDNSPTSDQWNYAAVEIVATHQ